MYNGFGLEGKIRRLSVLIIKREDYNDEGQDSNINSML